MKRAHPWRGGTLALLLAAAAAPSHAQDTVSEGAQWELRPSQADFERLGPPAAVADRVSGRATIDCALTATGRLRDCRVTAESPAGAGFGQAALRLSAFYKMRRTQEVELEGSRVPFVVRFRYAGTPLPTTTVTANVAQPVAPLAPPSAVPDPIAAIAAPGGDLAPVAAVPGWQADFLDIDRTTRDGLSVETYRVTVYAAGRADQPRGAYEVARLRLDCAAGSQALLGVRVFDRTGTPVGWRDGSPARAVEPDTVEAALFATACNALGARPDGVTLAEALAGS